VNLANSGFIISMATRYRLPAIYPFAFYAKQGGLISYGFDAADQFRQGAVYVDKILRGANPADQPVQHPPKFEVVINMKTANALDLDVPFQVQQLADEVRCRNSEGIGGEADMPRGWGECRSNENDPELT
jgi:putative ABC transport system substrate-binding protein